MADDLSLVIGVDYSEVTGFIKTAGQTKRALGAIAKDFANTGSQKNYMASINRIVAAQKNLDKSARMSRSKIMQLGNQMKQEAQFANSLAKATTGLSSAQMAATKSSNRLGVVTQQAGYQVSDFIVQVQGGTNAFVAFSQQASQLVGVLPLVAGRLGLTTTAAIGLSSVLGIAIPLVGAVGAAWLRSRESAEDLEGSIESLDGTLQNYVKTQEAASKGLTLNELIAEDALDKAKADLEKIKDQFSGFKTGVISTRAILTALVPFAEQLGLGAIDQVKDVEAVVTAAEKRISILRGKLNNENLVSIQETLDKRYQENDLLRTQLKYGKDSVEYTKLKNKYELQNLETKLLQEAASAGVTEEERLLIEEILRAAKAQQELNGEIDNATDAAETLTNKFAHAVDKIREMSSEIKGFYGALASGGMDVGALEAQLSALKGGATSAEASGEALRTRLMGSDMAKDIMSSGSAAEQAYFLQNVEKRVQQSIRKSELQSEISGFGRSKPSGGGSKADPAEQLEKFMAQQEGSLAIQRESILLGEESARVTELVNKYKEAGIPLDMERIHNLAQEEQELQKLQDAHTSLTDALMSVVDGTQSVGDAFKGLLREMLLDIYREKIAKPFATSVLGFFGFADGGVFSGGSQVKAFANGGVVGGPTTFPMSGGQTGLMGEAGPEAIMPLKRGANGKLGVQVEGNSSGEVNIVQNFSFAANGDESVKKLIAQAAPQIANMTQKQIIDSRRRGGTMKSTFG